MENNGRLTYTAKEAAELLGLSKNSVYQACLNGEIPNLRIGKRVLIPKSGLDCLLRGTEEIKTQV